LATVGWALATLDRPKADRARAANRRASSRAERSTPEKRSPEQPSMRAAVFICLPPRLSFMPPPDNLAFTSLLKPIPTATTVRLQPVLHLPMTAGGIGWK